jgi:hypothetical protein
VYAPEGGEGGDRGGAVGGGLSVWVRPVRALGIFCVYLIMGVHGMGLVQVCVCMFLCVYVCVLCWLGRLELLEYFVCI